MIRFWAAAKAAAGVAEEPYEADTLAEVLENACRVRDAEFSRIVGRSSFLVDDRPVGTRAHGTVRLEDGATIEVLPPFAGG